MTSKNSASSIRTYIQSRTHRVTATLLLVSCSFLLLNSPYCAIWIVNYIHKFRSATLKSWKEISEIFMLMNFSINFLLYCVSGKAFRNELICLLRCQWKELYDRNDGERRLKRLSRPKIEIQLTQSKLRLPLTSLHPQQHQQQQYLSYTCMNRLPTSSLMKNSNWWIQSKFVFLSERIFIIVSEVLKMNVWWSDKVFHQRTITQKFLSFHHFSRIPWK